jgi:opacity protein-like surface antigen
MKTIGAFLLILALAAPVRAQSVSFRPFFLVTGEQMAAKSSFDATFGQSFEPFFGGGVSVVLPYGVWIDASVSRFEKTGQRTFDNDGKVFQVGSPFTASVTPIEVTGGYRFRTSRRLWAYVGAGIGSYEYAQSSSFDPSDTFSTRHLGYLAVGGAEGRVQKWISLAADVQFTRVSGILGSGAFAISKDFGEDDLGGIAVRFRVLVGK